MYGFLFFTHSDNLVTKAASLAEISSREALRDLGEKRVGSRIRCCKGTRNQTWYRALCNQMMGGCYWFDQSAISDWTSALSFKTK